MFDAYNLRKIAPRMLIAVIGVNLSIDLCIAAVDITNVIGGGLGALLRGPFIESGEFADQPISAGTYEVTGGIIGVLVAGGAFLATSMSLIITAAVLSAPLVLLTLLLLFLGAILIALAVMATVTIRFGAIILLTLVSPVAIAMLVLPGTEKYFRKWWDYFLKTLVVYPIIAAIFAISDIMGAVFLKAMNESGGAIEDFVTMIVIIVVVYAPLFMIPFSFKLAGGFLGSVYDFANKNMYGRAKPHMDKWKESEAWKRQREKAAGGWKRAGLHPEAAYKKFRASSRVGKQRQAERDQKRDELEEYEKKVRDGTATKEDLDRAWKLADQGNVAEDGTIAPQNAKSLLKDIMSAGNSEIARTYSSNVRDRAIKAEEADVEVKDIQGIDDAGKFIRAYLTEGIAAGARELRKSNPYEYDYTQAGLSDEQREGRKKAHDAMLNQAQALQNRYGDDVLGVIGARQDARASTGSDSYTMHEDAIRAAGGKRKKDGSWDMKSVDTIALARNLDDFRGFAKEANRLDKAGIGFSGALEVTQSILEGTATADQAKEALLMGALEKNSASAIATMHDKGVEEMTSVLQKRIATAKNSGSDSAYQRAVAEAANLYDAFQYAAPKNMDKLSGLVGDTSITRDGNSLVQEIEKMRGDPAFREFMKYRRDFSRAELEARQRGEGGGDMPGGQLQF